jgi:hypothetical protein
LFSPPPSPDRAADSQAGDSADEGSANPSVTAPGPEMPTRVGAFAANECSTYDGAKQKSDSNTAQSVIHAANAYLGVLNGFARNGFDCAVTTGPQKKRIRGNTLDHTCSRDSARCDVDTRTRARPQRRGVLAAKHWRRAHHDSE